MKNTFDVAIIGGGINGSSIAYQLSKLGKKVVILEKGTLACEASSAAAGMLAAQAEMEHDGPFFQLALKSQAMFPSITNELLAYTGIDIEFVNKGMLKIAETEELASALKSQVMFQQNWDSGIQWLDATQVREMEPALAPTVAGAMFLPNDGHVQPAKLSLAFAKAAEHFGTEIRENTEVLSFIYENGVVKGVYTSAGAVYCEQVVVATGAWAADLMKNTGINMTVYPVKGECFSVKPNKPIVHRTIFSDKRCYFVPKRNGEIYIGATVVENTFDKQVTAGGIATLIEQAVKLIPQLKDAPWERVWAGIRPQTVDGIPYIGEHPNIKGLFVAAGHYRNGILLSPLTGKLTAQLLTDQVEDEQLLSAFRIDRSQILVS
ncbi:glycine oxidase ThiO [Lysinibacillus xylanilyticus]|uniref:glycine oxidase ThiO n=1 Tax=Lysinibacillus xylanilyticus TaxID=582475 RepID=UPI002B23F3A5|nr:glycine oxidase ThiO [Lysinibacillus xylanilyticus]MEB2282188.1 glycine oxidase ThiO [Lysinibacillus xylanilyticus]